MGFFSKIFKGVKKVFKKIGRGIKKVVGKVGKFMDKIGIVGQIALAFILPGIGQALASTLGNVGTWAASALANPATNALVKGVAHVTSAAAKFAAGTGRIFKTVTSAVKNFTGEIGKTILNKIPGISVENASTNIFGTGGAIEKAATATGKTWDTTIGSGKWWDGFARSADNIPPGFTGPRRPEDFVSTQEEYDDLWKKVGSDMESQAVSELGSPKSLLDKYRDNPISGSTTEQSAEDFMNVYESITPQKAAEVADVGKDYFITERSLAAAGTEAVKQVGESLLAPEAPDYDYSQRGDVVVAQNAYEVQPSQAAISQMPAIGYGIPMLQYDSMYKPTGMYSRRMQGFA